MEKSFDIQSRLRILASGKRVFAQKGLGGATVREIAADAKVNASAISYHFSGKENLYRECLESFAKLNLESALSLLPSTDNKQTYISQLLKFSSKFYELHLSEKDVCKILHMGLIASNPLIEEIRERSFKSIPELLHKYFEQGKQSKFIKDGVVVEFLVFAIITSLVNASIADHMFSEKQIPLLIGQILTGVIED